jgi:phage replication O-like protein O
MMIDEPNYTQIPNVILDEMAKDMGEAELRVVLAICRKTFGWHKVRDKISLSQLEEMTGLSRPGVLNGIEACTRKGLVLRVKSGLSYTYELVITSKHGLPVDAQLVNVVYQSGEEVVNEVYIQKKVNLKKGGEIISPPPLQEHEYYKDCLVPLAKLGAELGYIPEGQESKKGRTDIFAIAQVLAEVCKMSFEINKGRLMKAAKDIAQDDRASATLIRMNYSPGAVWYQNDWRGKKGEKPKPEWIKETMFSFVQEEKIIEITDETLKRRAKR